MVSHYIDKKAWKRLSHTEKLLAYLVYRRSYVSAATLDRLIRGYTSSSASAFLNHSVKRGWVVRTRRTYCIVKLPAYKAYHVLKVIHRKDTP